MAERKEYELKAVTSLKDCEEGLAVKLNLDEDAWEFGAPPPKGAYRLKLFQAKDGIKQGQLSDNVKDVFYSLSLECRIVSDNPDYDGVPVFTRVDTRIYRGKDISTMAGLLTAAGFRKTLEKETNGLTPLKLTKYMEAALKKEPIVTGEVDWRGSYQFVNGKGEETWANPLKKYEDFPALPDNSGKSHITSITDKVTGMVHEVRAQAFVSRFFGKDDVIPKYDTQGAVKELKVGTAGITPQLVKPIATPITNAIPSPLAGPQVIPASSLPNGAADSADDLNLMLDN